MALVDLSHPMRHGLPAFPNDPKLSVIPHGTIPTVKYNISQISMGSHQGTHLDAMYHFFDEGKTLDKMPLDWFHGPARVLRIPKSANSEITVEDLKVHEQHLTPGAKIILDTGWHKHFGTQKFFDEFPSITLDAARYLASKKIRMLGMDLPTPSKDWYEAHRILLAPETEIVLVEAIANLDKVPDTFNFIGFPLNFEGRDGSPIRAVAQF